MYSDHVHLCCSFGEYRVYLIGDGGERKVGRGIGRRREKEKIEREKKGGGER